MLETLTDQTSDRIIISSSDQQRVIDVFRGVVALCLQTCKHQTTPPPGSDAGEINRSNARPHHHIRRNRSSDQQLFIDVFCNVVTSVYKHVNTNPHHRLDPMLEKLTDQTQDCIIISVAQLQYCTSRTNI